jgi:hypothetical protein
MTVMNASAKLWNRQLRFLHMLSHQYVSRYQSIAIDALQYARGVNILQQRCARTVPLTDSLANDGEVAAESS